MKCKILLVHIYNEKILNVLVWLAVSSEQSELLIFGVKLKKFLFPQDTYHHHWREGNLSSSARCEVCKKTCGSSEVLSGMRCEWCGILVCCTIAYISGNHICVCIYIYMILFEHFISICFICTVHKYTFYTVYTLTCFWIRWRIWFLHPAPYSLK